MSDEKKKVLCPDPECNTENESDLQFCSKCQLDLSAFFTLDRVLTVRDKAAKHAEAEAKKKKDSEKPARRSGLAGLMGGKK